jgi:fluoride exporter
VSEETKAVGMPAQLAGVFVAGGIGVSARVLLAGLIEQSLPEGLGFAGILIVDLLGCLVMGFAAAAISAEHWRNIALGGLIGGFTTYSGFALLSVGIAEQQRWGMLASQVGVQVIGGVVCVLIGVWGARALGLGQPRGSA